DMRTFVGDLRDKSSWDFSLMIMQPDCITKEILVEAVAKARKQDSSLSLEKIRFDTLEEGKVVQILHIGSFDNETDVIREMHDDFIVKNKLVLTGKHHEIYLSDFRRTAPEKLRTILRQPVIDQ
ncbi:GyrI-like domain-containing protein, partial [Candidatus Saccharibacteria bacterium]|nr:GyrI-like domain-containing protein [Candidatus Saccharibacteria bacterium]